MNEHMQGQRHTRDHQALHPRVAQALDSVDIVGESLESSADLPQLPQPVTTDTLIEWIKEVTPRMDPRSQYRKRLMSVVQRHEFRKTKPQH